ncbi:MAG: two-component regulator propeller domain-containing protein [bacterium]
MKKVVITDIKYKNKYCEISLFIILLLSTICFCTPLSADEQWKAFLNGDEIYAVAFEGNTIWVGTTGGLVEIDTLNHTTNYYNKYNSPLTQNFITTIAIDSLGSKFFGNSWGGLVKLSGKKWEIFNEENSGMPSNWVWKIIVDKQNNKWIATDSGLVKYNNNQFTVFTTDNSGISSNQISSLLIDKNEHLWVGTWYYGVNRFDGNNWVTFDTSNCEIMDYIRTLALDNNSNIWVGGWNGVSKYDGENWQSFTRENSGMPYECIHSISFDSENNLWIGSCSGLVKFDWNEWEIILPWNSGIPTDYVEVIIIDDKDIKWFGTIGGGLVKFSGTDWIKYNTSSSPLPGCDVNIIDIDKDNNKWMGFGYERGIAMFDGNNWFSYDTTKILKKNYWDNADIKSIAIDSNNNKWFGTRFNGVVKFDGEDWQFFNKSDSSFPDNFVNDIKVNKNGEVWFACREGLIKWDGKDFKIFNPDTTEYHWIYFNSIAFDTIGNIWTVDDYNVYKFDGENWTVFDEDEIGLDIEYLTTIYIDKDNIKWIGTDPSSIIKYDDINWTFYYPKRKPVFYYDYINTLTSDNAGNLWIGSDEGLSKFDGETFTNYDSFNSDLPSNDIQSIRVDKYNNKWIGTDCGLAVFNENGVILETDEFENYHNNNSTILICYPNPSSGTINLRYRIESADMVNIFLTDILGNQTLLKSEYKFPCDYVEMLDLRDYPQGIYNVVLQAGDKIFSERVVILQ